MEFGTRIYPVGKTKDPSPPWTRISRWAALVLAGACALPSCRSKEIGGSTGPTELTLPFSDAGPAAGQPPAASRPPSDSRPIVELQINGRKFRLMVDTGDSTSILASDVLHPAGLNPGTELLWSLSNAYGGAIALKRSTTPRVDLGFASLSSLDVDVIDRAKLDPSARIDGAVGLDFLQAFHATLDYPHKTLTLRMPPPAGSQGDSPTERRKAPAPDNSAIPLRIARGYLLCDIAFDGTPRTFSIDSGFRGDVPILVASSAVKLLGLNTTGTTPAQGAGYGGNFEGILLSSSIHRIGGGRMSGQSIVVVPNILAGDLAVGVLGSEFLRIARARIDFQTMRMTIPTH